MGLDQH